MRTFRTRSKRLVSILHTAALCLAPFSAFAASDTWNVAGGASDWNNNGNWLSGVNHPNGVGDVAALTNNITSEQKIRFNENITLGTLLIGDADGTHNFSLVHGTNVNETFIMDNGGTNSTSLIQVNAGNNNNFGSSTLGSENINLVFVGNLDFDVASGAKLTVHRGVFEKVFLFSGPGGEAFNVTKKGGGELSMPFNLFKVWRGNTVVQAGTMLAHSLPTNTTLIVHSGAEFVTTDNRVAALHGGGLIRGGAEMHVGGAPVGSQKVQLNTGGELRPGDDSAVGVGTLTFGTAGGPFNGAAFNDGDIHLDFASLSSFDTVDIVRTKLTINGGDLHLNFLNGYAPGGNDQFKVIRAQVNDAGYIVDGNGGALFDSITHNLGSGFFTATLTDPFLTDDLLQFTRVTLTYIPEPSAAMLAVLGAVVVLWRRQ